MAASQEAIDAALERFDKLATSLPDDVMGDWVGTMIRNKKDPAFLQDLAELDLRVGDKDVAFQAGLAPLGFRRATGVHQTCL